MTKIFVTRHGQAEGNRDGIIMGQKNLPLTDLGRGQARIKGKELSSKNISKIYSSDLSRCLETAQIMCQEINKPNLLLETDRRLREICFGVYQGQKYGSIINLPNKIDEPFKGGESNQQLINRVQDFLKDILNKHDKESILIVTHSGVSAVLESIFKNIPLLKARGEKINFEEIREYKI